MTGSTGAGKSTITDYLKSKNCHIIDADKLGRKAMEKGSSCLKQACIEFGSDILLGDGSLNRQLLAKRVFSSKENTQKLNDITHPWICMQVLKIVNNLRSSNENPIIIFDAPVLFESNMDIICDYIITVTAPYKLRKQRIKSRDNLTDEQAELRMKAQNKDSFYIQGADFVIDGSKPLNEIYEGVDDILKTLCKR